MGSHNRLQRRTTDKKWTSIKMKYFLAISFFVLTIKTTRLSASQGNDTSVTNVTSGAVATTAATATAEPASYGAALFARLILEFDAFKARDKALAAEVEALKATVRTKNVALTTKDGALTADLEALSTKVDELGERSVCKTGKHWTEGETEKTITYGRTFPRIPELAVSVGGFRTIGPADVTSDGYNSGFVTYPAWTVSSKTTSSFKINYGSERSNMKNIGITWMACL